MTKITDKNLTDRILARWSQTDDSKLKNFFSILLADFEEKKETAEHNKESLSVAYKQQLNKLHRELLEVQEAETLAWEDIKPEDIETRASQKTFCKTYLDNLDAAKRQTKNVEEKIKALQEAYQEGQAKFDKEITELKENIAEIKKK